MHGSYIFKVSFLDKFYRGDLSHLVRHGRFLSSLAGKLWSGGYFPADKICSSWQMYVPLYLAKNLFDVDAEFTHLYQNPEQSGFLEHS